MTLDAIDATSIAYVGDLPADLPIDQSDTATGAGTTPASCSTPGITDLDWPSHDQLDHPHAAVAHDAAGHHASRLPVDHFSVRNGVEFAGTHIILDLWGAKNLDNLELMESTLRAAVAVAGATLLHIHLHHFTPNNGISGVAVLAESHISVHTWPERQFAAFDVFMCGDARPEATIAIFQAAFSPDSINVSEHLRGANIELAPK